MPSASSRGRPENTSASVSAITSSATTSKTHIAPLIEAARSATTTGAPVTVYVAPLAGFHSLHRDRGADLRSATPR